MSLARVGLLVAGFVAAVAIVFVVFRAFDERAAPPIVIEDAAATWPLVVDVRGAVVNPGVHELPAGARVQDAIAAAGGFAGDADLSTINLARRLRDGEIVQIATLPVPGSSPAIGTVATAVDAPETGSPRININTATAAELDQLPGVGEVTAARIIAFREENGPYRSIDDLIHVQGISANTIDGFRDQVTTGP
jgi:competence protein ComEA